MYFCFLYMWNATACSLRVAGTWELSIEVVRIRGCIMHACKLMNLTKDADTSIGLVDSHVSVYA